jgi:hypothetical protein
MTIALAIIALTNVLLVCIAFDHIKENTSDES